MYKDSRYDLSLTAANSASVTKSLDSQAGTEWDKTAVTNFVTTVPDQASDCLSLYLSLKVFLSILH